MDEALAQIPEQARGAFAGEVEFRRLTLDERFDSKIDGASKLLFRTRDEAAIESVILRIKTGRSSLCISSQVGCAADCRFCATGKMGISRSLDGGENRRSGRRCWRDLGR